MIRSGNISYRRTDQEARLKSAQVRREQRKRAYSSDAKCKHGPPDKKQHFTRLEKSLLFKKVDVKYSDGMWYRGKITAYDEETDHYTVFFDTDGETTTFQLPDPDVKVIGLSDNDGEDDESSRPHLRARVYTKRLESTAILQSYGVTAVD